MMRSLSLAALLLLLSPAAGRCQPFRAGGNLFHLFTAPPRCHPTPPLVYNHWGYCAAGYMYNGHYWSQAPRLLGKVAFKDIGDPRFFLPPPTPPCRSARRF